MPSSLDSKPVICSMVPLICAFIGVFNNDIKIHCIAIITVGHSYQLPFCFYTHTHTHTDEELRVLNKMLGYQGVWLSDTNWVSMCMGVGVSVCVCVCICDPCIVSLVPIPCFRHKQLKERESLTLPFCGRYWARNSVEKSHGWAWFCTRLSFSFNFFLRLILILQGKVKVSERAWEGVVRRVLFILILSTL